VSRPGTTLWILIDLGLRIGDVDGPSVKDGSPGQRPPNHGANLADQSRRNRALVRDDAQHIRVFQEDSDINTIAETSRALGDHVEHGLNIGWRATMTLRISLVAVCWSRAPTSSRVARLELLQRLRQPPPQGSDQRRVVLWRSDLRLRGL
jgi:hypothetical protein